MPPNRHGRSRVDRHGQMLLMVADGATVMEMAAELEISRWTVIHELAALREMFGARNNCNLVALAYQKGILNGRQMVTLDD